MALRTVRALGWTAVVPALMLMAFAPAAGRSGEQGLWPLGFSARQVQADCGRWGLDLNDFCVANDARNGLEVGVKFRTSTTLQVTGIRIYRVDAATVHGSLWDGDGTLLARGTFAPSSGHEWQDLRFAEAVTIVPDRTYVASYFTPGTKYAFEYWYFQQSSRTVGPVTAMRSVEGDPNGVHCYDDAPCGSFPVQPYRDSTYFVSPLWASTATPPTTPTTPPGDTQPDTTAPRATAFSPVGKQRVRIGASVRVAFSEPMRASSLTSSTVRLIPAGSTKPIRATWRYLSGRRQVVIDPRSPLRPLTKYRMIVTNRVLDLAGNRLDQVPNRRGLQDATSTFRTRSRQ